MRLTDTHCHLDMQRYDADRKPVLKRASEAGVGRILIPALDLDSARRSLALTEEHPIVYAAVGVHPTEIPNLTRSDMVVLQRLATAEKVVAIGEIGLDYYWVTEKARRLEQQAALRRQLELAEECERPAVLHLREKDDRDQGACSDDMLRILQDWVGGLHSRGSSLSGRAGVLHSFAGTLETARLAIDLGFYIGITGPITYPNAEKRRELVGQLPLERLLLETDSPFLTPQPHRGQRNEPAFVAHIADRIARIQSRTPIEVAEATAGNAARLFTWEDPV